jgi:hypothetical protein
MVTSSWGCLWVRRPLLALWHISHPLELSYSSLSHSYLIDSSFDEIGEHQSALLWVIASRGIWWLCFAAEFTCFSWWLPPPRRLGAVRIVERRKVIVSSSDRGDCEGLLTFPQRRAKMYSSGLLVAYGFSSCVGCVAPNCGLGVWCLLARECHIQF